MRNKYGFTYLEILISMAVMFLFLGFFFQLNRFNYDLRNKSDDINKVTRVAQGVMDSYRVVGIDQALTHNQGYDVSITEDTNTGHDQLIKVTVTVTPKVDGLDPITLVSYHTSRK